MCGYYNLKVAVFGEIQVSAVITLFRTFRTFCMHPVILQVPAKCFVLQRIRVHYISLQVLLTAAFILWPPCTFGFGIREKIRSGLQFFAVFLCSFVVFGPS